MVARAKKKRKKTPKRVATQPAPQAPLRYRHRRWLVALVLVAAAAVYLNTLSNGFVWDDDKLIVQDPAIKTTKHFSEIWLKDFFYRHEDDVAYGYYRPAVTMTYMMDYGLWRLQPAGYHATNILLHVACTLLVILCLTALRLDDRAVIAAGLLFAVHPIHTENVSWIAGRTDLVAFLFTALSLWLYLKAIDGPGSSDRPRRPRLAASLFVFALALLSKEMSLVLLPWIGLILLIHHRRGLRASIIGSLPHAAVATAYLLWRFVVIDIPGPGDFTGMSKLDVAMTAPSVMVRYLGKMLAPIELNAYLQHPYVTTVFDLRFVLPTLVLALLARLFYKLRDREPGLVLMAALLPVTFLPVLNFQRIAGPTDMGSVMAERFCYFPSFPFVAILGIAFAITQRRDPGRWARPALALLVALAVAASIVTVRRSRDWSDELTFLNKTLAQSPGAVLLWGNLADEHTRKANYKKAEEALIRGQELSSSTDYQIASSRVFWYASQDRAEEAIPLQERIVRRTGRGAAEAKNNLAYLYRVTGRAEEAQRILLDLLEEGRDYSDVHVNLAEIYRSQGFPESAIKHYEAAFVERPQDQAIALSLGALHLATGDVARAEAIYRQQLELYPEDPDMLGNLATTLFRGGNVEGALGLYRDLVARHPGYARGRISYAQVLFTQGQLEAAVRELEAAVAAAAGSALEPEARALLEDARTQLARRRASGG